MINEKTNNKFLENGVYIKKTKALGQTFHMKPKANPENIQSNNKMPNSFTYNDIHYQPNNANNTEQKKLLEDKRYLKKPVKGKLKSEIRTKNIPKSFHINNNNYDFSKPNNINNIISSFNKTTLDDITKKPTNISLINNSLILNYMNKINNNISLNSNNISLNTNYIRSSMTSNDNSNTNEKSSQDNIMTPNYKKIIIKKESNKELNSKKKLSSNKTAPNKKYMSCKREKLHISNKKINNDIDLNTKKYNFKIKVNRNTKISNPFNIEKLIDNFMEKKLEKENEEKKNEKEKNEDIIDTKEKENKIENEELNEEKEENNNDKELKNIKVDISDENIINDKDNLNDKNSINKS